MISVELSILTLNVWGIPYISTNRKARIEAIGAELATGKYDLVSLQEVWSEKDSQLLRERTEAVLPHSHYFYSGVIGAGLLVLSKYPIVGTLFHVWILNGYCHRVQHADWFGGKGVGLCKIRINDQIVHLYNAHLHAEYNSQNDDYKTHRVIQAFDTAQFIEATRGGSVVQILAGDLNAKPDDISYKILLSTSQMYDSCNLDAVATSDSRQNSYTSKRVLDNKLNGSRIDHIFVSSANNVKTSIIEYKLPLPDRVPGQKFSYSDHEAVLVRLRIRKRLEGDRRSINDGGVCIDGIVDPSTPLPNGPSFDDELKKGGDESPRALRKRIILFREAIEICDKSLQQLKMDRVMYFSTALSLLVILVITVEFSVPNGFKTLYLLLRLLIFAVIIFCSFMGSIWNSMEHNGILSGKTSIEMKLRSAEQFELNHHN